MKMTQMTDKRLLIVIILAFIVLCILSELLWLASLFIVK